MLQIGMSFIRLSCDPTLTIGYTSRFLTIGLTAGFFMLDKVEGFRREFDLTDTSLVKNLTLMPPLYLHLSYLSIQHTYVHLRV